jgi:hypothetical protein
MKYETPELTALPPAIIAVQCTGKGVPIVLDSGSQTREETATYTDWE